ncbi:uncharacterized protein OCT59_004909 [Rhizophagus irregularis]|uniref:uncharacterized protein n=1 Tax=Rhizophagus irregularis TaxID=588596 RepID=UPI00332F5F6E|nr:hypothetical protein OCT59_004909 [Rhizophagus irregularis]
MSNGIEISHKNCYDPYGEFNTLWCKECVPRHIIEGWTSENHDIDEFIKDTIYNAKYDKNVDNHPLFLEWVPFDRFENIKQIGEGGFSKVYSATWIDGKAKYIKQDDGTWKKGEPKPMTIALKKLNDSQNISAEYLKETKTLWNIYFNDDESYLNFYGITKDPETKEFIMIVQLANQGSLRQILSNNFNNLLWKDKLRILVDVTYDLKRLHKLTEELEGLLLFWYYSLDDSKYYQESGKFGNKGKEVKALFEEADKEIPNISTSYEKNPDAIYTSRIFTFSNLPNPINSSIITSYFNEEGDNNGIPN